MKVKLCISREVEIEVDNPVVAELDNYWRTHEPPVDPSLELDEMVNQVVRAVERVSGIPFGDDTTYRTQPAFVLTLEIGGKKQLYIRFTQDPFTIQTEMVLFALVRLA